MATAKIISKQITPTEDLSEAFSKEGIQKLKKGQLLRFNYEGSMTEFIITRLNKKSGIVLGKQVFTKKPEEVTIGDEYGEIESFTDFMEGKDED